VHEWNGTRWTTVVSAYCKLRLSPAWLVRTLEENNFAVDQHTGLSGMVFLIAKRV